MGAVREGGLLLTEEKRCRLAGEDNCTESDACVCVFAAGVCSCMLSFFPLVPA